MPVVLEYFASQVKGNTSGAIQVVQSIADKDYPSQARRQLQNRSAVEDRTRWAIFHACKLGFADSLEKYEYAITPAGKFWLRNNPYPLTDEQRRHLGALVRDMKTLPVEDSPEEVKVDADFFWILRAGRNGEQETEALERHQGFPGMEFGPETNSSMKLEDIKSSMRIENPDYASSQIDSFANQLFRFKNQMQIGDLVVMPSKLHKGQIYYGRVTGDYVYDPAAPKDLRHSRPIEWSNSLIYRSEVGPDLRNSLGSLLTICKVSRNNALSRMESIIQGDGDPEFDEYSESDLQIATAPNFDWVPFFQEFSKKLLEFKTDRQGLFDVLRTAAESSERPSLFKHLWSWVLPEGKESATNIDPFVILGTPNRQISWSNKIAVCTGIKSAFGLSSPVPQDFSGIPQLNNLNSRFERTPADPGNPEFYNKIWDLLETAISYADDKEDASKNAFTQAFHAATEGRALAMYTMALFWARPETYLALDGVNVPFLEQDSVLGHKVPRSGLSGQQYLDLLAEVSDWIGDSDITPATFYGLSHAAYEGNVVPAPSTQVEDPGEEPKQEFTIDSLIAKGCFVPRTDIELMMSRLREKKNLILQGPPGTGKTWIARELAKILCNSDSDENITAVQFHPSMSYEDFIQGFRPGTDGRLVRAQGPFLAAVEKASDSKMPYVVVIEEINRGNPSQIFGEMLTLLEADKRGPEHALTMLYGEDSETLFLPENLYVIGTMNQADRSLAMVDMALRRRFAFVSLQPQLGDAWREFCVERRGRDADALVEISNRLERVNQLIAEDYSLGRPYQIGHSFVTPLTRDENPSFESTMAWFQRVVASDILPLLEEYWFDNPSLLQQALDELQR